MSNIKLSKQFVVFIISTVGNTFPESFQLQLPELAWRNFSAQIIQTDNQLHDCFLIFLRIYIIKNFTGLNSDDRHQHNT